MVDLPGGDDMLAERMSLHGDVPDDVGIERLVPVVNRDTDKEVGLGEATEIERRWLQGWCERRGAGEPELEYDPSKLGIHAVLQQITNLLSNQTTFGPSDFPVQWAKLKGREVVARLADVEALGKDPNEIRFDEVFAEVERCIGNESL
eukprot:scaffold700_cov158-Pinguiococcus_pyrenoidosus.AAC.6